jgi:hypothetical protein
MCAAVYLDGSTNPKGNLFYRRKPTSTLGIILVFRFPVNKI